METNDLFEKIGIAPSDIAGIKQGPGTVGKFTSVVLAAAALLATGIIVGGITHSLAIIWIGLLAAFLVMVFGFAGIVYITKTFPTQSLEGLTLLLDRHPEAILPYLTKGRNDTIDASFTDTSDESSKPKLLPDTTNDDSPDAPDKPETPSGTDSEGLE